MVVAVIVMVFMRKSRQSARAVKHMRNQMDVLEARVAKECKEGARKPRKNADFMFINHTGVHPPQTTRPPLSPFPILLLPFCPSPFLTGTWGYYCWKLLELKLLVGEF